MRSYVPVLIAALIATGLVTALSSGTHTSPSKKKATSGATAKKHAVASRTSRKRRPASRQAHSTWRTSQQAPTPARYREIQQALMQRGYLSGAASGVWGAESMEAMKRFQRDQNLSPTGKPSSLSLIALGLGPKRDLKTQDGQIRQGLPPEATPRVQP